MKASVMFDLFTWSTPNGRKVSIALEELKLPYTVHPVDIGRKQQFDQAFTQISPNNKIPAIIDRQNGFTLMESGAILLYLADQTGQLLPSSGLSRYRTIEWLMWQVSGPGPTIGQLHTFIRFNKGKAPFAEERLLTETRRLYSVLEKQLSDRQFLGDEYSIADIAMWPWVSRFQWHSVDLHEYPSVLRWYSGIAQRPAVKAGYKVPSDVDDIPMP